MSKWSNSSQNSSQAKQTRLPTGFQLVCPIPPSSQPTSSSHSSLFVTISTNSCQCGVLTGKNRLLPSAVRLSEPPSGLISDPQPAATDDLEGQSGTQVEVGEMLAPETDAIAKPKRKRYTTNSVSN